MKLREKLTSGVFLILALSSISALVLITVFIIVQGAPIIAEVGLFKFIFGMTWAPGKG